MRAYLKETITACLNISFLEYLQAHFYTVNRPDLHRVIFRQ